MDPWHHLFDGGEYASPERTLSGLTLEHATRVPSEASHTIYQELWHLTRWQRIMAFRDEALYALWERGERYPDRPPASERDWQALVAEFFEGLDRVFEWTGSDEALATETDPGITMRDSLPGLAVHNAYHLGKIVALRQALGLWPPP